MEMDKLIDKIEIVFSGTQKPMCSLRQFQLTDLMGQTEITDEEWNKAKENRVDSDWKEIPDNELEECGVLLTHMAPEEYIYYLPAYIRYSLKNIGKSVIESQIILDTVFSLSPNKTDTSRCHSVSNQLSSMTVEQKKVMIEFLKFLANNANDYERSDARVSLDRYWLTDEALNKLLCNSRESNSIATSSIEEGLDFAFNLIIPSIAETGQENALQAQELLSQVSDYVSLRYAGELQLAYEWLLNFEQLGNGESKDPLDQFHKQLNWLSSELEN